jgi:ATP-dependent Zn protease
MRKSTLKKMQADREAYLVQQQQAALHKDIYLSSMHEAGHALAYTLCGAGVEYVTVEQRMIEHNGQKMKSTGFTQPLPRHLTKETIEQEAICIMAGPVVEDMFNPEGNSGRAGDITNLKNCAIHVGLSQDEGVELLNRAVESAQALVNQNSEVVEKIAMELRTRGRIEGAEVSAIVKTHQNE